MFISQNFILVECKIVTNKLSPYLIVSIKLSATFQYLKYNAGYAYRLLYAKIAISIDKYAWSEIPFYFYKLETSFERVDNKTLYLIKIFYMTDLN
jgi:hypothetical protein